MLEQRIGRIYRLGQKLPIDVYNLVCEQGIESRIAALVGSKQAFFKGLFDGDSDTVQFGQSSGLPRQGSEALRAGGDRGRRLDRRCGGRRCRSAPTPSLDDEVADPFDDLIEAADESRDQAISPSAQR